tara:strand:- start:1102 stop:1758 length:657 start_codon:yes stop_codon:yes gene_type:complete
MDYTNNKKFNLEIHDITQKIEELEELTKKYYYQSQEIDSQMKKNQQQQEENDNSLVVYTELREFLSKVSAEYRIRICSTFNHLVTEALSHIFDKNIDFQINLETYRNQPSIDVMITEDSFVLDPQKSCGGGMNDIIALIFKIIFVYLSGSQKTIILDESLKFLSTNYLQTASNFLSEICNRLKIQLILITHKEDLQLSANNIIAVSKVNGASYIDQSF